MATKNETLISELKINYLTEELYAEALANGQINNDEIYMTPGSDLSIYATKEDLNDKANAVHTHEISDINELQSKLDEKQKTITGAATTIANSNLTTNRALVSNASGKVIVSAVTSTELGYLDGVTSNVQDQLNGKANDSHTHSGYATSTHTHSEYAESSHNHSASNITSGTLSSDRLPTVPLTKGGTGATTAAGALTNLGITATASELNKLDGVTATTAELNYVDGVTSNIQTQLNGKQSTISGGASTIASSNLTTSRALISNSSGKVAVSDVTSTELGYLDGVTSNIQTQLNNKASSTHTHDEYVSQNELNSIPNLHVWKRYASDPSIPVETTKSNVQIAWKISGMSSGSVINYSDSISVSNGKISLVEPSKITYNSTSIDTSILLGKYVFSIGTIIENDDNEGIYFISTSATFTKSDTALKVSSAKKLSIPTIYDCVGSTLSDTYPTFGQHSDGYWYEYNNKLGNHTHSEYANVTHTHDEYATLDHTHDDNNMEYLYYMNSRDVTKVLSMADRSDGIYMISTSCSYSSITDNSSDYAIIKKYTSGSNKYLNVLYTSTKNYNSKDVPLVKVTSNTEITITHIISGTYYYHISKL